MEIVTNLPRIALIGISLCAIIYVFRELLKILIFAFFLVTLCKRVLEELSLHINNNMNPVAAPETSNTNAGAIRHMRVVEEEITESSQSLARSNSGLNVVGVDPNVPTRHNQTEPTVKRDRLRKKSALLRKIRTSSTNHRDTVPTAVTPAGSRNQTQPNATPTLRIPTKRARKPAQPLSQLRSDVHVTNVVYPT